jgi:hypothetical protein
VDKAEHDAEGEHPQFRGHGDGVSRKLPTVAPGSADQRRPARNKVGFVIARLC